MSNPTTWLDIHDHVNELTRTHAHNEPYTYRNGNTTWTKRHTTLVPPLIHQLQYATPSGQGDDRSSAGYNSRPAARLEALDTLIHIDLAAARWIRDLGEDDPADTLACIRRLHGLHASAPEPTRREIERDIRHWWTQARIVTGWDSPAWRPDNTCPMCATRGTLRVKLIAQAALCIDCRETWDQTTIGLLADHIRHENADDIGA